MTIALILLGIVVVVAGAIVAAREMYRARPGDPVDVPSDQVRRGARDRLSAAQWRALSAASETVPIYAERQSFRHAQMPGGREAFDPRTIESLVRRGYLRSDGKHGYLLTGDGYAVTRD